jgi:hypothetical protein
LGLCDGFCPRQPFAGHRGLFVAHGLKQRQDKSM